MSWESIVVDKEQCTGCGICAEICPMDNLRLDDAGYPFVRYDQCWYCEACELECPAEAIKVVLPFLVR